MKRAINIYLAVFLVLCPAFVWAQNPKKKVVSAADLPRFSYDVPENLTDLLTDDAAYKIFAAKVRVNLETVLRDYEIEDKTTLKNIQTTLAELDLQENRLDSALERYASARGFETKPELKYFPLFLEEEIIAKAQKKSGAATGEKFLAALRTVLADTLAALPASVFQGVKEYKYFYELVNEKFFPNLVAAQLAPQAKKNGDKLFGEEAAQIIGIRTANSFLVPVVAEFARSFAAYIAAHNNSPKINVWTNRAVTLNGNQKLAPVVVAVWDTGVDAKVFSRQMFVNRHEKFDGKDNDRNGFIDDVNGISFDLDGKYTTEPLFFVSAEDQKKYADWTKERQTLTRLLNGVDDEETRRLKQKLQTQTPAEVAEDIRLYNIFERNYAHGTQVASIVAEGNPAARILSARRTWGDRSGQNDSLTENTEYARSFAARIKAYADYFKKQNARVVNMSWSLSRRGIEENLEKNQPQMSADERRIEADKSFSIIKNALLEAFRGAPEILFIASAGNTDSDAGFNEAIPASLELPNLITVGAVDERGAAAPFTSFGKNVSLYAQGVNVPAQIPGGEKLLFGGTSAAAPAVANLAAKLFALQPNLTVAEVVKLIRDGADASAADNRLKLINSKKSVELLISMKK